MKITPPVPPRRRSSAKKVKKRKYKIPNRLEIAKLSKIEVSGKMPNINRPSLQEQADDVSGIIPSRKSAATLQFIRKRSIQSTKIIETKKKRKKCEEILMKQGSIFTENDDTSLIEMDYVVDSSKSLNRSSGNGADIMLENIKESKIVKTELAINSWAKLNPTEFIHCRVPCPAIVNPMRKWTIEEDRKILYIHKENGPDLDLTLASIQLELPEIPVDELRQRKIEQNHNYQVTRESSSFET
ncbi:unnamed protein product [Onchocerca ochengi]|nr:unnamed protein product [Onchocerca ochengi]VDM93936.1 unnamed protein product [Onchocerca ochengi]